jgi:multiple sugar transport system substrate-binding protein
MSRKLICVIMAVVLAMVACGCQKEASDTSGSSASDEAGLIYDEKEIGSSTGLNSPGNARIDSKNRLVVYDNDNPGRFVVLDADGKPQGEIVCAFTGWLGTFDLDSQDNIYVVINEALPDNEISQKVCAIDSSGRITATFELGKYRTDVEPEKMPMVVDMAIGSDGNFYLAALTGIIVLDSNGKIVKKIGDNSMRSIDTDPDNNIIVISIDKGKRVVEMYDSSSGKSIWSSDINALAQKSKSSFSSGSQKVRYDDSAKNICVMVPSGVYRYDCSGNIIGTVLDFSKYLILASGNQVSDLNVDLTGNIYITTIEYKKYEIYRYDIAAGVHEVRERKAITIAVPVTDRRLEVAAMKFQKAYPDYRIDIKPYEQDNNTSEGFENYVKTLNTELLTGKGPDIIAASWIPYEKYIDKNMFVDLGELMEQDKDFDESIYYMNIFDAVRYKGRLYTLPVCIRFNLLSVNKKILEQGSVNIDDTNWTWKDFRDVGRKLAGGDGRRPFISLSCLTLLDYMLKGNYGSFVNEQEKKSSFDSPEFTDLLNMVKEFGDSDIPNDSVERNANFNDLDSIENGIAVFSPQTISDYVFYGFLRALYNDQVRLLNYPSSRKEKGGVFDSDALFSINSNSKNKDIAWEFLKFLLSDEVQSGELESFAVNKESLAKAAQKALEMTGSGGMSYVIGSQGEKPKIITPRALTQQDIDYINGFIENMRVFNRNNASVNRVVQEETSLFFAGQRTADETARLIQEKVSIYLGE